MWEEWLRETPREKWSREERAIPVAAEEVDAFTDEEFEAYNSRG